MRQKLLLIFAKSTNLYLREVSEHQQPRVFRHETIAKVEIIVIHVDLISHRAGWITC